MLALASSIAIYSLLHLHIYVGNSLVIVGIQHFPAAAARCPIVLARLICPIALARLIWPPQCTIIIIISSSSMSFTANIDNEM